MHKHAICGSGPGEMLSDTTRTSPLVTGTRDDTSGTAQGGERCNLLLCCVIWALGDVQTQDVRQAGSHQALDIL